MSERSRPAEFDLDKKWDKVIDLGLRRIVYGSLAAGITSLILFSKLEAYPAKSQIYTAFLCGQAPKSRLLQTSGAFVPAFRQ